MDRLLTGGNRSWGRKAYESLPVQKKKAIRAPPPRATFLGFWPADHPPSCRGPAILAVGLDRPQPRSKASSSAHTWVLSRGDGPQSDSEIQRTFLRKYKNPTTKNPEEMVSRTALKSLEPMASHPPRRHASKKSPPAIIKLAIAISNSADARDQLHGMPWNEADDRTHDRNPSKDNVKATAAAAGIPTPLPTAMPTRPRRNTRSDQPKVSILPQPQGTQDHQQWNHRDAGLRPSPGGLHEKFQRCAKGGLTGSVPNQRHGGQDGQQGKSVRHADQSLGDPVGMIEQWQAIAFRIKPTQHRGPNGLPTLRTSALQLNPFDVKCTVTACQGLRQPPATKFLWWG